MTWEDVALTQIAFILMVLLVVGCLIIGSELSDHGLLKPAPEDEESV